MKTEGVWQGVLKIEEGTPTKIIIGHFNLNSILYFLAGKRVILLIEIIREDEHDEQAESGRLSTMGKIDLDQRKKEFVFEKFPFVDILESFVGQNIRIQISLDQSVRSSRM